MSIKMYSTTAQSKKFRIYTDYEVQYHKHTIPGGDVATIGDAAHPQSIREIIRNTSQYSHIYIKITIMYIKLIG